MSSKFFLKPFVTVPLAPVITGINILVHFMFHIRCITIRNLVCFSSFSSSICVTFLSAGIATSISMHVFSVFDFNLLKPAGHLMHQQFNIQQLYALPTLYLCFVFIWEQTVICATYSINWFVFITEMQSVYCAVRTGPLNTAACASPLKGSSDMFIRRSQHVKSPFQKPVA